MFPDTSGVVNGPLDGKFHMYPKGGATVEPDHERGRQHVHHRPRQDGVPCSAAKLLDTKCKVPFEVARPPHRPQGDGRLRRRS